MTNLDRLSELTDALAHAERELTAFFELSVDLFVIADDEGNVLRCNKAWETVLGRAPESLVGTPFRPLVHPEDWEATITASKQARVDMESYSMANRMLHKNGEWVWVMWHVSPQAARTYSVGRDMTAEQKYTQRFELIRSHRHALRSIIEAIGETLDSNSLSHDRLVEIYEQMKAEK